MPVRLGVIGLGNMGTAHCRTIESISEIDLVAVSDIRRVRVDKLTERYGCAGYDDPFALIGSGRCDAVLIATPHYDHTSLGIAALKRGLHVLVEKPISAQKSDCEKLIKAHCNPNQVFAAMFNQRTNRHYQKIRQMIQDGSLGNVRRFSWTITDWFRPQSYYNSGGWRATWAGEGGGVLLNQSPHQLDLMQWLFGMPSQVHAFCEFGKYHDIEVEDSVTARLKYDSGTEGLFVTTTGEAPGLNRLEISAENGLLVYDTADGAIRFKRNDKSITLAIAENAPFSAPQTQDIEVLVTGKAKQHMEVLENFAAAILQGEPLIAPAAEGIASVELANAMLLSGATEKPISLPLSSRRYAAQLKKWAANSRYKPDAPEADVEDLSKSF
ncbi:MAG: putative dehydrogenase [Planctomycetaceae bacterium]